MYHPMTRSPFQFPPSDFPSNRSHAAALLDRAGITHVVSITPDSVCEAGQILTERVHKHFIVSYTAKESLLVVLPILCKFVDSAMQASHSRVFLHCMDEERVGVAVCAYRASSLTTSTPSRISILITLNPVMFSRRIQAREALEILQDRTSCSLPSQPPRT
jgi:uncharacterized Zn-finger protein